LAKNIYLAMITFQIKHIMLRAILLFLKNAKFVCSVDKYHLCSATRERFLDREGAENIKYMFRFAPKFSNICIN